MTESEILDTLIRSQQAAATAQGIDFKADIAYAGPYLEKIDDTFSLFANLLSNALDAAEQVKENPFIVLAIRVVGENYILTIKNSCTGLYRRDESGQLLSTKGGLSMAWAWQSLRN